MSELSWLSRKKLLCSSFVFFNEPAVVMWELPSPFISVFLRESEKENIDLPPHNLWIQKKKDKENLRMSRVVSNQESFYWGVSFEMRGEWGWHSGCTSLSRAVGRPGLLLKQQPTQSAQWHWLKQQMEEVFASGVCALSAAYCPDAIRMHSQPHGADKYVLTCAKTMTGLKPSRDCHTNYSVFAEAGRFLAKGLL